MSFDWAASLAQTRTSEDLPIGSGNQGFLKQPSYVAEEASMDQLGAEIDDLAATIDAMPPTTAIEMTATATANATAIVAGEADLATEAPLQLRA